MVQVVDLLTQLDVILIASMLSGTFVKMGKGYGKLTGQNEFASFYKLFMFFIVENIIIAFLTTFFIFPITSQFLYQYPFKALSISVEIVLLFNAWFARTFGYKQRIEVVVLLVLNTILMLFASHY
jgi:hypothetical protein